MSGDGTEPRRPWGALVPWDPPGWNPPQLVRYVALGYFLARRLCAEGVPEADLELADLLHNIQEALWRKLRGFWLFHRKGLTKEIGSWNGLPWGALKVDDKTGTAKVRVAELLAAGNGYRAIAGRIGDRELGIDVRNEADMRKLARWTFHLAVHWDVVEEALCEVRSQRSYRRPIASVLESKLKREDLTPATEKASGEEPSNEGALVGATPTAWAYNPDDYIDLNAKPPALKPFKVSSLAKEGLHQANVAELDACLRTIAFLDGGRTNRQRIRDWGRPWLRARRKADVPKGSLIGLFYGDAAYEALRRPDGNPKLAGLAG